MWSKIYRKNTGLNYDSGDYQFFNRSIDNENNPKKVTVITPVYNAEKYLVKTIDSVLNQTLGMENIEYIIVDDCSTDSSRDILFEYASKHPNIFVILMKSNTGTPGKPRNIGIQLATSKYVTFLDSDDWLDPEGLKNLHDILEETDDDYVVGKTIQFFSGGTKIIGEHESCKERRSISPYSIPHIFHHLGPRARMIKTSLIKQHKLEFPEMKFAEDKQFFIDVLVHCKSISTTVSPIYYLNRKDNQQTRLSNQTNILQKTNCNLKVIHHIIKKQLPMEKERIILNRLYEYDSISRFFTTPHYQRTRLKRIYYYKFHRVLRTTKTLRYDISENFLQPLNKLAYHLLCKKKYKELQQLFEWDRSEKVKEVAIIDQLPYLVVPFLKEKDKYIRIPMYAVFKEIEYHTKSLSLHFKVYGDCIESIRDILIKDGKNAFSEFSFPGMIDKNGEGYIEIDFDRLNILPTSTYSIYIRFNDYMKINIKKQDTHQNNHHFHNREFTFYKTVYSNIGMRIK